ncbi:hypothetical protein M413DRAFT_12458 [Hebeloma cylindrosporum]|uniref:SAP domain-containing protein n=1 Tax=Hebeloma cylindrosporum TaxID=76867 RepID=A0A0C3C5B6_HEBCY|nr:hypothetical protein M413DRAFT_12458 [Hebeloma cylindrosporum h7]
MASTTSLPEPAFTKPITSMTVAELRQTCQYFELSQTGITPTLRNRLQNFLTANKHEMQHDYDYVALYPNRDPLPVGNQPANNYQDSQAFSQWNGIDNRDPTPEPPQRPASRAAAANNRVEEYLQGITPHSAPLFAPPQMTSQVQSKRPRRELGMTVSSGGFIVPDLIRDKFIKWETHVPLTYLMDKFCASQPTSQSSLSDFLAVVDGQVTAKSKNLSSAGELTMTYDEWHQGWQRLLKLIEQYHPEEIAMWRTHFSSIVVKEMRSEDWPLWLAYDTEVRRRSVTSPLDPSQFQKRLFDDLYVCYSSEKILAHVQSTIKAGPSAQSSLCYHPYQRPSDYSTAFRGDSFRSHSSNSKITSRCRCFFCGGLSHSPKSCIAITLVNGRPLLLPKPVTPDTPRVDRNGRQYCFGWNGKNANCTFNQCT